MRTDCHVCRSEGLTPQSRVLLSANGREIIATLHQVTSDLLDPDEAGLSETAWDRLEVAEGDAIRASHPNPIESLSSVRRRIYGHRLDRGALHAIISDVVKGQYADVHLSSFITACAAVPLDDEETIALTRVMVDVGERLSWAGSPIVDKHSVGGLPGNRTTPIVVSIVAAHGLTMPKTSSRAITSPAGTADTMETMAPVDLDLPAIRRVVEQEVRLHRLGRRGPPQPCGRHPDPDRASAGHRQRGAARRVRSVEEDRGRLDAPRPRCSGWTDRQGEERGGSGGALPPPR